MFPKLHQTLSMLTLCTIFKVFQFIHTGYSSQDFDETTLCESRPLVQRDLQIPHLSHQFHCSESCQTLYIGQWICYGYSFKQTSWLSKSWWNSMCGTCHTPSACWCPSSCSWIRRAWIGTLCCTMHRVNLHTFPVTWISKTSDVFLLTATSTKPAIVIV